ncbi:MAG: hypothetical protein PVI21_05430 [Candidatus Woesebacteria bacterium]|jgi:hypothetical protein
MQGADANLVAMLLGLLASYSITQAGGSVGFGPYALHVYAFLMGLVFYAVAIMSIALLTIYYGPR